MSKKYEELVPLLRASASANPQEAAKATETLLALAAEPVQEGVFDGPVLFDKVFTKIGTPGDYNPKFPIHYVVPGTEDDYAAYTVPKCGAVPYRMVDGDDKYVFTYRVGNAINACRHYVKNARFDVVSSLFETYMAGYTLKLNADAGHTLAAAANARNIVVQDAAATAGVFTFKLVSDAMNRMKRAGGGNSSSPMGFRLTDTLISPEAMGDMRILNVDNWTVDRFKVLQDQGSIYGLFGVNFHELFELGVGGSLQDYIVNVLGRALTGGDLEYAIGLDLTPKSKRNFVMPVAQEIETHEDMTLHRSGRWGIYGDMWVGFGVLDNRGTILMSF